MVGEARSGLLIEFLPRSDDVGGNVFPQVCRLGEIPAREPVRGFVAASLPRTSSVAEINLCPGFMSVGAIHGFLCATRSTPVSTVTGTLSSIVARKARNAWSDGAIDGTSDRTRVGASGGARDGTTGGANTLRWASRGCRLAGLTRSGPKTARDADRLECRLGHLLIEKEGKTPWILVRSLSWHSL